MKFEDLVNISKKVRTPEFERDSLSGKTTVASLDSFINDLKDKDRRYSRLIRVQQYILLFSSLTLIGLLFLVDNISALAPFDISCLRKGIVLLFGSYLFSFWLFHLKYRKYKQSGYDNNILGFLSDTKKRYSYFTSDRMLYIPILILLDFGLYLTLLPFITLFDITSSSLIINLQLFLGCTFAADLYIKYKLWKKHQKPIRDEVGKIVDEIDIAY